ncbi:Catalase (plasmid) [Roseomonas mucosa]|uniref:Catalase n=1 Tax=Roseomonas mucosa TaxID=207340 RepID=A0A4Y1MS13_9PROT|nr:Catalase [Roseomonas mucosa]
MPTLCGAAFHACGPQRSDGSFPARPVRSDALEVWGWCYIAQPSGAVTTLGCGSAWNRNPVGGVIGVQTGPH